MSKGYIKVSPVASSFLRDNIPYRVILAGMILAVQNLLVVNHGQAAFLKNNK
jgi:hypothetical protein